MTDQTPEIIPTVQTKKKSEQKIWTDEEDTILKNAILFYQNASKKWKKISTHLNKSPKQCYSRFRQINPVFKQGIWTKCEEDRIIALVEKYGKNWAQIAKIFKTRSGKQIRHHFLNILDTNINKTPYSLKEDIKIKELYLQYGPKWKKISEHFNGRTGDTIKNRFYNKIKNSLPEYAKEKENSEKDNSLSKLILIFRLYQSKNIF